MKGKIHHQSVDINSVNLSLAKNVLEHLADNEKDNLLNLQQEIEMKIMVSAFDALIKVLVHENNKGESLFENYYLESSNADKRKIMSSTWTTYTNTIKNVKSIPCPIKILDMAGSAAPSKRQTKNKVSTKPPVEYIPYPEFALFLGSVLDKEIPYDTKITIESTNGDIVTVFNKDFYHVKFNAIAKKSLLRSCNVYVVKVAKKFYFLGVENEEGFYPYTTNEIEDTSSSIYFELVEGTYSFLKNPELIDAILGPYMNDDNKETDNDDNDDDDDDDDDDEIELKE
jgi:hypothetical protein